MLMSCLIVPAVNAHAASGQMPLFETPCTACASVLKAKKPNDSCQLLLAESWHRISEWLGKRIKTICPISIHNRNLVSQLL